MLRFFAGAAAAFLLLTSVFLIWQLRAEQGPGLPAAPAAGTYQASMLAQSPLRAPEASPQDREKRRFSRFDKNKDGKVQADEYLAARHRNFDKLDIDHNGALAFQEYAVKGIEKFDSAGGKSTALCFRSSKTRGQEPDRRAFDIAFAAGDLAGETDIGP